jgi:tetratricopeptide (TPR) repeat protein
MFPGARHPLEQAIALSQSGNPAAAERLCLDVLRADPRNVSALNVLAITRIQMNRLADALAAYDEALKLRLDFTLVYGRAVLLRTMKRPAEAVSGFEQAIGLKPRSAEAWNGKGNGLRDLNRPLEAIAAFDKALTVSPETPTILFNRAMALRDAKRYAEALAGFDLVLARQPAFVEAWVERGTTLRHLRRFNEALESYHKALAVDPRNVNALNNRGTTLQDMRRLEEAGASFDQAITLAPDNPELRRNRAKLLCARGRTAEGLEAFMQATALAPKEPADPAFAHRERHDLEQKAYLSSIAEAEPGQRLSSPAVRQNNDIEGISQRWREAKPQIVVIDNFLTDEALEKLRRFCWDSQIWKTGYPNGYLGAMPETGFASPLLAQIADELRDSYPAIFRNLPLHYLWAFKYDSSLKGINIHADEAAVNVNFWITPDEANLDPESGGLVVWDVAAPLDWDFDKYNGGDYADIHRFLAEHNARSVTIPYRANRAVIFDSDLFHETDTIRFKDGYLNRRINVTLLYGRRDWQA